MGPSSSPVSSESGAGEVPPALPRRRFLRQQLNACFVQDADLDAFCLDWFPEIYQQFTRGMTRNEKLNLLLGVAQSLDDISTALEEEWALRTQKTVVLPSLAKPTCAPRPQRGQLELEVVIEDDFHKLSPDKLAGWIQTIRRLIGQELKVVLRNCRSGSVILTLSGDWRALVPLMRQFIEGRLKTVTGYRVREVRWLGPSAPRSRAQTVWRYLRMQHLRGYVALGQLQRWLGRVAATLRVPRWAIAAVLFFLLSSAAWATQKVVRTILSQFILRAPAVEDEAPDRVANRRRKAKMHSLGPTSGDEEVLVRAVLRDDLDLASPSEAIPDMSPPGLREPGRETKRSGPDKAETDPAQPEAGPSEVDETLLNAHTAYRNGNYRQAISIAKSVQHINPTRAWRIIGAAACSLLDVKLASEAFKHLDLASRQYLVYTCQHQGISNSGSQFKLR